MDARAMVRQSMPIIKRMLDYELSQLPLFFTQQQLDLMCDYIAREAVIEIQSRTPVGVDVENAQGQKVHLAGTLKRGMRAEVVRE